MNALAQLGMVSEFPSENQTNDCTGFPRFEDEVQGKITLWNEMGNGSPGHISWSTLWDADQPMRIQHTSTLALA